MFAFIVFTAILNIAVGYGLAVYLGYAPVVPNGTHGRLSSAPTQFASLVSDDDIVIAGDDPIAESANPPTIAETEPSGDETGTDETVSSAAVTPPRTPETIDPGSTDAQPPTANLSPEDAISLAVDDLTALSTRVREVLIGCADDFAGSNDDGVEAPLGSMPALALASGAIAQELGTMNSLASPMDGTLGLRVRSASEHFSRDMTEFVASTNAMEFGSSGDADKDRVCWLSAVEATFKLRDAMARVRFELANCESRISNLDETTLVDEETDLPNAAGIAKEYAIRQQSRTTDDNLVVSLLDIDHCHQLNSSLGPIACGDLIVRITELVRSTVGDAGQVGRFSGQRFAVLISDLLPNAATDEIERVRETLDSVTFRVDGVDHRVSMTCGLAEATQEETASDLMNRLEETLAEAKRYGKNRTFVHEGEFPAPVIPSKFDVASQVIEMTSATRTSGAVSEANQ